MTKPDVTSSDHVALANVYFLLGRLWLAEVDDDLLLHLTSEPLKSAWLAVGQCDLASEQIEIDALASDYCRLFIGPSGHFPPVQSVWTHGRYQSECATSMTRYISLLTEYEPAPGVEADHLGIQLQVMGTLVNALASTSNDKQAESVDHLIQAFHHDHLGWPGGLLESSRQAAGTGLYSSVIQATQGLLSMHPVHADKD